LAVGNEANLQWLSMTAIMGGCHAASYAFHAMHRQIIRIDTERCDGCGKCISGCPEGALQLIDGKARVVSESTCDGLGACVKECPRDAIAVEMRDAAPYDERETLERILPQGEATLCAHLRHLFEHAQKAYLNEALQLLRERNLPIPEYQKVEPKGCPGSAHRVLPTLQPTMAPNGASANSNADRGSLPSQLTQWPIQLHLIRPQNPVFADQTVLLVADCVAFALPDFNQKYLPGKRLAVACPKLDQNQEIYLSKLVSLIDDAQIKSLDVLIMEVPCCGGLYRLAEAASKQSKRRISIGLTVVGLDGELRQSRAAS